MLNPFPIQFLALLAYTILRFFVGSILLYAGIRHLKNQKSIKSTFSGTRSLYGFVVILCVAFVELIAGGMLILGYYTQIAALLGMFLSLVFILFHRKLSALSVSGKLFYVLLLGTMLSLFITGAGAFAFDLPI